MKHDKLLSLTCRSIGALIFIAGTSVAFAHDPAAPADKSATKDGMMPGMAAGGDMQDCMKGMMKNMDAMKMTGDTDLDFATMMKVHHQGAIDMAQMELKSGKDAKVRALAKRIIEAQQKEIKEFDQWLAKHK